MFPSLSLVCVIVLSPRLPVSPSPRLLFFPQVVPPAARPRSHDTTLATHGRRVRPANDGLATSPLQRPMMSSRPPGGSLRGPTRRRPLGLPLQPPRLLVLVLLVILHPAATLRIPQRHTAFLLALFPATLALPPYLPPGAVRSTSPANIPTIENHKDVGQWGVSERFSPNTHASLKYSYYTWYRLVQATTHSISPPRPHTPGHLPCLPAPILILTSAPKRSIRSVHMYSLRPHSLATPLRPITPRPIHHTRPRTPPRTTGLLLLSRRHGPHGG